MDTGGDSINVSMEGPHSDLEKTQVFSPFFLSTLVQKVDRSCKAGQLAGTRHMAEGPNAYKAKGKT